MITKVLFVSILLVSVLAKDSCPVFSCKDASQNISKGEICAQKNGDDEWDVNSCSEPNQYCQVKNWIKPEDAEDTAYCAEENPQQFPPKFIGKENAGLDGDYCLEDSHCYRSENNQANCINNVCTSPNKIGDQCGYYEHRDCPKNAQWDGYKKWAPLKKAGDFCTSFGQWEIGVTCASIDRSKYFKECIPERVLEVGEIYGTYPIHGELSHKPLTETTSDGNYSRFITPLCKSHISYQISFYEFQCREPDKNANPIIYTQSPDSECYYGQYVAEGKDNHNIRTSITKKSSCGFNKDSNAWCPIAFGDQYALEIFESYQERMKEFSCHKHSKNNASEGSICAEVFEAMNQKDPILFNLFRHSEIIENPSSVWANTANNDECVRDTITLNHWSGLGKEHSVEGLIKSSS